MNIDVINLGPMDNCTYLVSEGQDALLIDPAWDMNFLEHTLQEKGLRLLAVFFTHGHFDHVKFAQNLLEKYRLKGYMEKNDVILSGIDAHMLNAYSGEQTFDVGPFHVEIIPTPGHTAGGVCIKSATPFLPGIRCSPAPAAAWTCRPPTRAKCAEASLNFPNCPKTRKSSPGTATAANAVPPSGTNG